MGGAYENQRVVFDVIYRRYMEYVQLYKDLNKGSLDGLTGFEDFYWRYVYLSRYSDASQVHRTGY